MEFLVEKRRHMAPAIVWPPGYFEEVVGSIPDFPEIDGDMGGIDPALDETDADLRLDPPEADDNKRATS